MDDEAFTMLLKIYKQAQPLEGYFFSRLFHPEIRIRSIAICTENVIKCYDFSTVVISIKRNAQGLN